MHSIPVTFPGAAGHTLSGRLELPPDGEATGGAVIAHCFTCTSTLTAVVQIARALARERLAVLRFDFTGLGESEGEFVQHHFSACVEDLAAAAEFMEARGFPVRLMVGHSLGGTAALAAAASIQTLAAVATIAAPFDPWHATKAFGDSLAEIERTGEAQVQLGGKPFRMTRELLEDLRGARMEEAIHGLRVPLLILHSPVDQVVGIDNATKIWMAARHPKSFVAIDDADHLLTRKEDAQWAGRVIANWASRWLPESPEPTLDELAEAGSVVTVTPGDAFRTEVSAGRHLFIADEPVAVGGADAGPTPYDLLMAALGTCTGMTLKAYAERKGWPLEEVTVRLTHGKVHGIDEQHCADREARVDRIERELRIEGDRLTPDQRIRLLEIADKCPVHRTLAAGVIVETTELHDDAVDGETPAPPETSPTPATPV
ncbi:MAG TPA: alpha/beta fold hydrolase [Longimicrobium sp.]|nr:alpha/beta fold hydrolase [Longimicrobium sp.]